MGSKQPISPPPSNGNVVKPTSPPPPLPDRPRVDVMQVIDAAWDEWAAKEHNHKWARRVEGTPIRNDLSSTIARHVRQAYEPVETPKRSRDMRITSAALRRPSDGLIASLPAPARHGEIQLHTMHKYTPEEFRKHPWEYGFLLQDGTFVNRKQAASIARRAKQLIRPLDPGGELTTDHVW